MLEDNGNRLFNIVITAENLFKQLFKNATFMLTAELEREMLLHHKSNDTEETPNLEI